MNNQFIEIMRCRVGSSSFGIERSKVQSVQHGNRVRVLSAQDEMFEAVLKTNEGELPVLRLGDFVGLDSALPVGEQRLMVLRSSWGLWCLLVDLVSQAEFAEADRIQGLPHAARNGLASEVFNSDDGMLLMLSPDNIHPNAIVSAETDGLKKPPIDWQDVKPADKSHLVLFQMPGTEADGNTYSIGLTPKQINEVLRSATLQSVPTAPEFLAGVITWRGQLVPVMNLGKRLGLSDSESQPEQKHRIVVAHGEDDGQLIAFYAEPDVDVLRLPAPHRQLPELKQVDQSLLHGVAEYAGQTVIIPHISNLALAV